MKQFLLITILIYAFSFNSNAQSGAGCGDAIAIAPGSYIVDSMIAGAASYQQVAPFPSKAKWFKYTATNDGLLTISSCGGGADTRLFVYMGNCDTLAQFAFNDDYCQKDATGEEYAASVSKPIKAGNTYYFEFDNAWDDARFTFTLDVSEFNPTSGQACQTAIAIKPGIVKVESLTGYATRGDASRANWYKFTAPSTGKISIGACNEDVDTRLFIYDACGSTKSVAESDDDCLANDRDTLAASIVNFSVTAGKTYYFEWDDGANENYPFEFDFVYDGALSPTEDVALSRNVSVAPNPARDFFTVNFNLENSTDISLQLFNQIGQVVFSKKTDGQLRGSETIDVRALKNGMYFLQVRDGERIANKKIIISH
jgi:hypothetical protein